MTEFNSCPLDGAHKETTESLSGVSRRSFLTKIAIAVGTIGLTSLASSAQAKPKKYKICSTKAVKVGGASSFRVAGLKTLVLVTQPRKGTFRAFDQRCTHEGSAVNKLQGKNLMCQKHGATFDPYSGYVKRGPASRPLTKFTVSVVKNFIYITIKN